MFQATCYSSSNKVPNGLVKHLLLLTGPISRTEKIRLHRGIAVCEWKRKGVLVDQIFAIIGCLCP